jgi:hypothetical protein
VAVNADKPRQWKKDIADSVDFFNDWFLRFAPKAYRETRQDTAKQVERALEWTDNLRDISPKALREHPEVLPMLRMATAPPLAHDRLVGLAGVLPSLVSSMEKAKKIPPRMNAADVDKDLGRIGRMITRLADPDIFTWIETGRRPAENDVGRAATIVADRLCGAIANPIIRNAQERRQLQAIEQWLEKRGYVRATPEEKTVFTEMKPGSFGFHVNVPVSLSAKKQVKMPVDAVIMPKKPHRRGFPVLVEAKSAGDFTNVNKRRKEEATKMMQLRRTYGENIPYVLFLCGYFDTGYLGYEAAEGIDWVWEHRMDDLAELGL